MIWKLFAMAYTFRWQYRKTRAPHLGLAKIIYLGEEVLLPSHVFSHTRRQVGTSASRTGQKWTQI